MFVGLLVAATVVATMVGVANEPGLPDEVRITEVPDAYRIVYEVRAGTTVTTDFVEVDRPFRSLVATRSGPPPGGRLTSGRISDLNRLLQRSDDRWVELQLAPAMAASDLRLDRVLDDLVEAGDVERREVRRVASRACQVHRLGGPVGGGTLLPVGSVAGEHADICIDDHGLVLSEEWTADGEVLRVRTAVDVDVDPDFDAGTFSVDGAEVLAADAGGGSARRVTDDSPFGARTWELREPPPGFELLGRWAVVRPRLEIAPDPLAEPSAGRIAGIATVWVAGPDALVVEQGGTRDGARPFLPHPDGKPVDLGALDLGEVVTDGRGTEARVAYVDGTFVRVWSTLPRDEVVRLARSLEAGPGGAPVAVEG